MSWSEGYYRRGLRAYELHVELRSWNRVSAQMATEQHYRSRKNRENGAKSPHGGSAWVWGWDAHCHLRLPWPPCPAGVRKGKAELDRRFPS